MKHTNKINKVTILFSVLVLTIISIVGINIVLAVEYNNLDPDAPASGVVDRFTLEMYKCNKAALDANQEAIEDEYPKKVNYDTSTDDGIMFACAVAFDYNILDFSTYKVEESVDPGTLALLRIKYDYEGSTGNSIMTAASIRFFYNNDNVTPVMFKQKSSAYGYIGDGYGRDWYTDENWNMSTSVGNADGKNVMFTLLDDSSGTGTYPANNHQEFLYYGFKINGDATAGATLPFYIMNTPAYSDISYMYSSTGNVSQTDGNGKIYASANTLSLKVAGGDTSQDDTLSVLTVSNTGHAYSPDSTTPFVSGNKTNKTYLYYVSSKSSVATIDISATANDAGASVAIGDGTTLEADSDPSDRVFVSEGNGISVGMNTFTIAVTAPYGNVETYTVNVYKLSDDASLASLTTTGITLTKNAGTTISGVNYENVYNGTTTFDKTNTTVNATLAANQNATIASGTGPWTFTESGTTPNTKTVVVQAEDCQHPEIAYEAGCTSKNYRIEILRQAANNDATLKDLKVNGVTFTGFNTAGEINETWSYGSQGKVANNVDSITIAATTTDENATIVSGTGQCPLTVGANTCEVVVRAQDGETTKTYKINTYRLSNDNSLNTMTVTSSPQGTLTPAFSQTYTTGAFSYGESVSQVTISASVNDVGKAKLAIADSSGGMPAAGDYTSVANSTSATFNVPDTTSAVVIVTAEDGTIRTYTVNLSRQQSTNNYLNSLAVKYNDGTEKTATLSPSFAATERNYTTTIPANVSAVTVNVAKAVQYSKVTKIGTQTGTDLNSATISNLDFGENPIEVVVVNEAGNDNTYTVRVTREKYSIKTLDALNLGSGFNETFASGTFTYTHNGKVPHATTQLSLTGTKTNQYASVSAKLKDEDNVEHDITITPSENNTFSSTVDIPTGVNTITVTVTAQDNTTQDYKISVERIKNTDNEVKGITVADQVGEITSNDPFDYKYYVTVPYSKLTLQPAEVGINISSDATVTKGAAVTELSTSTPKVFKFTVTAEDGTEQEYELYVQRAANHEALITKVTLSISGATVGATAECTMTSSQRTCEIGVPTSTTGFNDTVEKSDGSTLTPNDGTFYDMPSTQSTMDLVYTIQSEDNQVTNTYTITVKRTKSSVNTLSDLAVKANPDGTYATVGSFTPSENNYTNTQIGTVESVTVKATVTDVGKAFIQTARVNGTAVPVSGELAGGEFTFDADLEFGDNAVVITVQAENEQTQNYNLTINRQKRNNALNKFIKYRFNSSDPFETILGYSAENGGYTLPTVEYDQTTIEFEVTPDDELGSAIITSVTNEKGTVTQSNVANTYSGEGNLYVATANLSTGTNTIVITGIAHNTTTTKTYTLTINRKKNTDTSISDLKVKGKDAIEVVGQERTYEVTLENSESSLIPENDISVTLPDGAKVTYSPTTIDPLSTADEGNEVIMSVLSESGETTLYTLIVKRTKSDVTTLSGVTLKVASPVESENNRELYCYFTDSTTCTLDVPTSTNGYTITLAGDALTAGTTDPENPITKTMPANESHVEIPITVTAENGTDTASYTVIVNRAKSANNNLADISYKVNESDSWKTINNFNPAITLNNVEVEGDVTQIFLSATVQDAGKASIDTDLSLPFPLSIGRQTFTITVRAEDNTTKDYYVVVTRKHKTDALLERIVIDNNVYAQDSEGLEPKHYYVEGDVSYSKTSVNIVGTVHDVDPDSEVKVEGNGDIDLTTGENIIPITVTADDAVTKGYYFIHITRRQNDSTSIDGIKLAGVNASYTGTGDIWTVTVPNNVNKADIYNVTVYATPGAADYDALATYTLEETELSSQTTTDVSIVVTAENGQTGTKILRVTREKSNIATLHNLTVEGGSFNPSFRPDDADPSALTYTVTIPDTYNTVKITAVPTEENASITGDGEITFTGNATFPVHVTSEDGTNHLTYYLNVVRSASAVNTLKSITISSGNELAGTYKEYTLVATEDGTTEGFSPETAAYTVTIPGDINRINIAAEVTDPRATITNAATALGERDISVGSHTVTIRVQSEAGSPLSYVLTLVRLPKPFNSLTDLTVDGTTVAGFDPDVTEYTLDDVPNEKASIVLDGTLEDPEDASVTGFRTCDLKVGENTCTVKVTAQDGTPKEYKIKVTRKASDENRLSMLTVSGYTLDPSFNMDTNEYTVNVKATKTKLSPSDITAIAKDSTATVVKDPELTLVTDEYSIYNILVTSASGKENTYTLRVFKPKSSDATLSGVNLINASLSGYISKEVTDYVLYVPHGVSSFSIEGVPTVETTSVISGNGEYTVADTETVTLITLAEDGEATKTYTFEVRESLSNDASLSTLYVQGYPFVGTNTAFNPAITTYSIGDIDYSVSGLTIIAAATNTTSSIKFYVNGNLQTSNVVEIPPSVGPGSITVHVVAGDGITPKDYTINYNKIRSSNAYLAYLGADVGTFTTDFIKTTTEYVLLVGEEVTEVNFTLYTESNLAYMLINGGSAVAGSEVVPYVYRMTGIDEAGDHPLSIVVRPQDEEAEGKTYSVIVRKAEPAANSDATLQSLEVADYPFVSKGGYTTTTFEKDVTDYHIGDLNKKTNKIKVTYETTQSGSSTSILVKGSKVTPDEDGYIAIPEEETNNGVVTIQVIAPNGVSTKNYNIHYNKVASSNAFLQSIVVANGTLTQTANTTADPVFDKEIYEYTDTVGEEELSETITITPEVPTVTIMIGGASGTEYTTFPAVHTITGLQPGTREVPITVTAENGNIAYYYVNIYKEGAGELITSETYGHDVSPDYDGYITTISPDKTSAEIKTQFDNDTIKLKILKEDSSNPGNLVELGDGELVGTGMYLKLYINEVEKDSKILVIKGDVSGDGKITITDVVKTLNHYLNKVMVSGAYLEAAEVSGDGNITITDVVKVLNHYLGKVYLTNHK